MDLYIVILLIVSTILFLAYFLIDVNYFIRSMLIILIAKFCRKKLSFFGVSEIYGIVLPSDADTWITHMNNARVFREFDFGRWDCFSRTGVLRICYNENLGGVVGAQTIRYRRPLHMFMVYKVVTTAVYYDSNSIYFEQKIVTLRDDIIRAVAYVRVVLTGDVDKMVASHYPKITKPDIPEDLKQWLKFNQLSSDRLNSDRLNAETKKLDNEEKPLRT